MLNYEEIRERIIECLEDTYRGVLEEAILYCGGAGVYLCTNRDASYAYVGNEWKTPRDAYNVVEVKFWSRDECTWRDYAKFDGITIPDEYDDPQAFEHLRKEEVESVLTMREAVEEFEELADNAIEQLKEMIGAQNED